ncbi:hypothetical protein ACFYPB_44105 [Streptomyces olivaceoviridis]|uniref:hypothetical protein n=1 Tax=Streptomyces olivaceoviridis TaxID=1921 RepID=UPI00368D53C3
MRTALRRLARRYQALDEEIKEADRETPRPWTVRSRRPAPRAAHAVLAVRYDVPAAQDPDTEIRACGTAAVIAPAV